MATPNSSTPLTNTAAAITPPVGPDLSDKYGLVTLNGNPTVYNKATNTPFGKAEDFFKEAGVTSFKGITFDTKYDPNNINNSLNAGQDTAHAALTANPDADLNAQREQAQGLIDKATAKNDQLTTEISGATSGDSSIASRTKQLYSDLGIPMGDIPTLQKSLADATTEYNNVKAKRATNLSVAEENMQGGGTEGAAKTLDTIQQRNLAVEEFAAATRMQVAQQQLSSATDILKDFTGKAEQEQSNYIQTLSQQLSLNKQDLTLGTTLLSQVMTETHNDENQARQIIATFATNNPDVFDSLTAQDKKDLSQGKITPNILTALGKVANLRQQKLDQTQNYQDARLSIMEQNSQAALARAEAAINTSNKKEAITSDISDISNGFDAAFQQYKAADPHWDGFVDPALYRQLRSKFVKTYGDGKAFDQAFPVFKYVAPSNRNGDLSEKGSSAPTVIIKK